MRTSFHHQPEAQHPNFQLSTSWQADYPIFRGRSGHQPAIAYAHATTLSLDQPMPGTDKMKWSDVVSADHQFGDERCRTVEFFGALW
jgi:hypothetical protein